MLHCGRGGEGRGEFESSQLEARNKILLGLAINDDNQTCEVSAILFSAWIVLWLGIGL